MVTVVEGSGEDKVRTVEQTIADRGEVRRKAWMGRLWTKGGPNRDIRHAVERKCEQGRSRLED